MLIAQEWGSRAPRSSVIAGWKIVPSGDKVAAPQSMPPLMDMIRYEFLATAPRSSTMPVEFGKDIVTTALRALGARRIRATPDGMSPGMIPAPKVTRLASDMAPQVHVVNSMAEYFADDADENELIVQWCVTALVDDRRVWFYALPGYPMMMAMGSGPLAGGAGVEYAESFFVRLFDGEFVR